MVEVKGVEECIKYDVLKCSEHITYVVMSGLIAVILNTQDGKPIGISLYGEGEMILPFYADDCEAMVLTNKAKVLKLKYANGFPLTDGEQYLKKKLQEAWKFIQILSNATFQYGHGTQRIQEMIDFMKEKNCGQSFEVNQQCLSMLIGVHRETISRALKKIKEAK